MTIVLLFVPQARKSYKGITRQCRKFAVNSKLNFCALWMKLIWIYRILYPIASRNL